MCSGLISGLSLRDHFWWGLTNNVWCQRLNVGQQYNKVSILPVVFSLLSSCFWHIHVSSVLVNHKILKITLIFKTVFLSHSSVLSTYTWICTPNNTWGWYGVLGIEPQPCIGKSPSRCIIALVQRIHWCSHSIVFNISLREKCMWFFILNFTSQSILSMWAKILLDIKKHAFSYLNWVYAIKQNV